MQDSCSTSILLVDDYEIVRLAIKSILELRSTLLVMGEAVDGSEAVEKAKTLKPDLILMDVGLPSLNGIEAARKIRDQSLPSKILFLSALSSPTVVDEALSLGSGYVLKSTAGKDLLVAIDAVLGGATFVSGEINRHWPN